MKRRGFTLMEVNLAMFIMAAGTLGLVALYTLGYRENRQSLEDVRGAAVAEANLSLLTAALSSTNMTWDAWTSIGTRPSRGWGYYAGQEDDDGGADVRPVSDPTSQARTDFGTLLGLCNGFSGRFDDGGGMACGLVVVQNGDICRISMRSGLKAGTLLYQPLYFTEVRFQGLRGMNPEEGGGE